MTYQELRFDFGENWRSFVSTAVSTEQIVSAADSIRRILGVQHLRGRSFLDIGCGSGLFSLGACLLGAKHVMSFDYDQNSVEASQSLRSRANIDTDRWQILQGSVLDTQFLSGLAPADVVYSWGVLHHTGSMWRAIDNAAGKVQPGGQFALAIYNSVDRLIGGSAMWWQVKRAYNLAPPGVRRLMELGYAGTYLTRDAMRLHNPLRTIPDYSASSGRGMDFWHDARDWLGGFPYEYATANQVTSYVCSRFGMKPTYLTVSDGNGCNEFSFRSTDY